MTCGPFAQIDRPKQKRICGIISLSFVVDLESKVLGNPRLARSIMGLTEIDIPAEMLVYP